MNHRSFPWLGIFIGLAIAYPLVPVILGLGGIDFSLDDYIFRQSGQEVGKRMATLFAYAILALGLNVVVGNAGLLNLGIAAFFGCGAYITGILMVEAYPFQAGFYVCVLASTLGAGLLAVLLSAPVLRLRGDYFALVTLGFGEVLRFTIRNLEEITAGTKGLKPIPAPMLIPGLSPDWSKYQSYYVLTLVFLILVLLLLRNLEKSSIGRAWIALREDELAASCMGMNVARVKLGAIALGAGLAGLAGCLYAIVLRGTSDPDQYGFNLSITTLCCLILGGVGNRAGVVLGVMLVFGFDYIFSPFADSKTQAMMEQVADPTGEISVFGMHIGNTGSPYLLFSGYRLAVFGLALILVMRFRSSGILPAQRGRGKGR